MEEGREQDSVADCLAVQGLRGPYDIEGSGWCGRLGLV